MAEYQEVMKQAKRMCESQNGCASCPLVCLDHVFCKLRREVVAQFSPVLMSMVEDSIIDWATANPEPRYPTWAEWQKANFPNASVKISPCSFADSNSFGCDRHACDSCRDFPIPADIAEKLGIKPIGGADDENA